MLDVQYKVNSDRYDPVTIIGNNHFITVSKILVIMKYDVTIAAFCNWDNFEIFPIEATVCV